MSFAGPGPSDPFDSSGGDGFAIADLPQTVLNGLRLVRYGEIVDYTVIEHGSEGVTAIVDGEEIGTASLNPDDAGDQQTVLFQVPRGKVSIDVQFRDEASGETTDVHTLEIDQIDHQPPDIRYDTSNFTGDARFELILRGGDIDAYTVQPRLVDSASVLFDGEKVANLSINPTPQGDGGGTPVNTSHRLVDYTGPVLPDYDESTDVTLVPNQPDPVGAWSNPGEIEFVGNFDAALWAAQMFGRRTGSNGETVVGALNDPGTGPVTGSPDISIGSTTGFRSGEPELTAQTTVTNDGDAAGSVEIKYTADIGANGETNAQARDLVSIPEGEQFTETAALSIPGTWEFWSTDGTVDVEVCAEIVERNV